jgi:glycosyltransferase involved in cell wall biosynthesis
MLHVAGGRVKRSMEGTVGSPGAAVSRSRVLVWQWGRRGVSPRLAQLLADGFRALPGVTVTLSLSSEADVLKQGGGCDWPVRTYRGVGSFLLRLLTVPVSVVAFQPRLKRMAPAFAVCVHPGPLDLMMALALKLAGVPLVVIVHDAEAHPGDHRPALMWLQRCLCRLSDAIAVLSAHVGETLREQGLVDDRRRPLIHVFHPPLPFDVPPRQPHDGPFRLLFFGRLLPYKGIDLLAEALQRLQGQDLVVRVAGHGPESPALDALRALPMVKVDNRWIPDDEVPALLNWADGLVLPYREASQSGVAAAALAAGRGVVATWVGGLAEQLEDAPGAILCAPDSREIATALMRLMAIPCPAFVAVPDPAAEWRQLAAALYQSMVETSAVG